MQGFSIKYINHPFQSNAQHKSPNLKGGLKWPLEMDYTILLRIHGSLVTNVDTIQKLPDVFLLHVAFLSQIWKEKYTGKLHVDITMWLSVQQKLE